MNGHDAFFEVSKGFGHTMVELHELGENEKKRWKATATHHGLRNKQYGKEIRADLKGGRLAAFGSQVANEIRHPVAMHGFNPNSQYRHNGVARQAALRSKEKKAVKASVSKALDPHSVFLEDVSKAAFGTRGDKRNTKYAGAALAGSSLGSHAGARIGAKAAGEHYGDVKMGVQLAGQKHMASIMGGAAEASAPHKAFLRAVKGAGEAARAEVPGYGAAMRGSKIGAAAGIAGGVAAYAAHRRKKGLGR